MEAFDVSVIIQWDFDEMVSAGLIRKVYGGAVLAEQSVKDVPDFITDTNDYDGVVKVVQYFCLDE